VETASHYVGGILLVTNTPPGTLEPLVARTLADADPNLTVINIRTLEEQVARSFDQQRAVASLAGLFGVIALILAAIGLYGVTAYGVARRRSEIGLRMALGATRGGVMAMVLRETAVLVIVGVAAGLLMTLAVGRLARNLLFGIAPTDPLILTAAAGVLGVLALGASYVPARAATRIEPTVALRAD
jgi:ABC-type antimicrobial peptide transport system permease subunit